MTVLAYIACSLIWGTTFFAIRRCIGEGGYPTLAAAAMRFVIASAILWLYIAAGRARPLPRGRAWLWIVIAGTLNAIGYSCTYTAEEQITGGLACVIFATLPLTTALLGTALGIERPTRGAVLGAVVSLGGIVLISRQGLDISPKQLVGILLIVAAVLCSTVYNIIFKEKAGAQHPLATNAGFLSVTAIGVTIIALVKEHQALPWPPPPGPTVALLYLAVVGSVLAFGSFFYLLKRVSLMTIATMSLLEPVIALTVDAIWEHQHVPALTYVGAFLTLAGVGTNLILNRRSGRGVNETPSTGVDARPSP